MNLMFKIFVYIKINSSLVAFGVYFLFKFIVIRDKNVQYMRLMLRVGFFFPSLFDQPCNLVFLLVQGHTCIYV